MQHTTKKAEHVHTITSRVRDENGKEFEARIVGAERGDGTWEAWIEFHPVSGEGPVLRTGRETSQPNRLTVNYWAGGLEPVYLEGALKRAGGT